MSETFYFSMIYIAALVLIQPPSQWVLEALSLVIKQITHFYPKLRLKIYVDLYLQSPT
jgi:hypothetical protein